MTDTEPLGPGSGDEMARPMTVKLSEIEKAAEKATAGPWFQGREGAFYETDREVFSERDPDGDDSHDIATNVWSAADAAFIAASRSAIPALTAALRDVLAEAARIKRDANDAWTMHSECADAGDVDAANVHGAVGESLDGIAARLRRAITAHVDPT